MGHMRHECQTETTRVAAPPTNRRGVNTIASYQDEPQEDYYRYQEDDDDYEITYHPAYPAISRNELDENNRHKPYNRKSAMRPPQNFKTKQQAPQPMVQDPPETPRSESIKERTIKDRKPREKKELSSFDPWTALGKEKVEITWNQLFEASPLVCTAVKEGISSAKSSLVTKALNVKVKKTRPTTSCYAFGYIRRVPFEIIVDTGAGPSLISQEAFNRLGWTIQGPTETTLVIADGSEPIPLGMMYDVPVTFRDVTVIIHMQVTNSTSYEVIIGTNWLKKAQAVINMTNKRMQITDKGVTAIVSLNITNGACPRTTTEFDTRTGTTTNQEDQEDAFLADEPPSD